MAKGNETALRMQATQEELARDANLSAASQEAVSLAVTAASASAAAYTTALGTTRDTIRAVCWAAFADNAKHVRTANKLEMGRAVRKVVEAVAIGAAGAGCSIWSGDEDAVAAIADATAAKAHYGTWKPDGADKRRPTDWLARVIRFAPKAAQLFADKHIQDVRGALAAAETGQGGKELFYIAFDGYFPTMAALLAAFPPKAGKGGAKPGEPAPLALEAVCAWIDGADHATVQAVLMAANARLLALAPAEPTALAA